jgi:hypothetical protein
MEVTAVEGSAEIIFRKTGLSWHLSAQVENELATSEVGL